MDIKTGLKNDTYNDDGQERCKACRESASSHDDQFCDYDALYDTAMKYRKMLSDICRDGGPPGRFNTDILVSLDVINETRRMLGLSEWEV